MKKFDIDLLGQEFSAAGLGGLPFSWDENGLIQGRLALTTAQNETIDWVLAAHSPIRAQLTAYAKEVRWNKEVGGVTIGGLVVATDDRSKLLLMGARARAAADPTVVEEWDASDGSSHQLTAPEILAISDAVAAHVSACFATYKIVKQKIDNGQITSKVKIDEAFA